MTPEQKSRQEIDRQLEESGWVVQSFRDMNISAGLGVAVREFPLKSGFADYLLYAANRHRRRPTWNEQLPMVAGECSPPPTLPTDRSDV